ncbi:MAG TPA: hypothetical protein PLN25_00345 [Deltaproteobacteria bacterium]|nr:hypothetical protein [Deltaproteobacteria bacterium]HQB39212.1 hypothetical protein [Deltaproteobacteria bacterium]
MIEECISKLRKLDRQCARVNEMTPAMHVEFEQALIELLNDAVSDNHKALIDMRRLQNELELTRWGLKAALSELCRANGSKHGKTYKLSAPSASRCSLVPTNRQDQ